MNNSSLIDKTSWNRFLQLNGHASKDTISMWESVIECYLKCAPGQATPDLLKAIQDVLTRIDVPDGEGRAVIWKADVMKLKDAASKTPGVDT